MRAGNLTGMPDRRPILVTGSHRSGTGWVGEMLAASPEPRVAYIWEPFSPLARPGICPAPFDRWFQYVAEENEVRSRQPVRDMLEYRYHPGAELRVDAVGQGRRAVRPRLGARERCVTDRARSRC